jgi:DNA-binding NtrC family response regulator
MSKPPDKAAPHILVADDSIVCRSVLVILLENAGYRVTSALDGIQALASLRKEKCDLAIIDNEMPNLDGIKTLTELRTFLPDLPVVICSGTVSPEQAVKYMELRINDLFDKPVDPRKLRDKIAQVLDLRRQTALGKSSAHSSVGTQTSPGFPVSEREEALNRPLFTGISRVALKFRDDYVRLREFRTAAIIEGDHGTGALELALGVTMEPQTLIVTIAAADLDAELLAERFSSVAAGKQPILLIVTNTERLTPEQQDLLSSFFDARLETRFLAYAGRIRLVLCTETSLSALADSGDFDEILLMRVGASIMKIPSLMQRKDDLIFIAQAVVRRISPGVSGLADEVGEWMAQQDWPGEYMQLHRTVELAFRLAEGKRLTVADFTAALEQEADFRHPLYHEFLPEKISSARLKAETANHA